MNKSLKSNIWKMATLSVTNKRPYMTFLTIFLLTMPNTTAKTIGILTLVGQLVGFVFEVPSGYLSDKIGHKNALIISRASMVVSTACYVFANNVYWFFGGAIFLAIGAAFTSGTFSAFTQETLKSLNLEKRYAEIAGKIKSFGFAVPIIFIITLPVLAEINFRVAFGVMLLIDTIGLLTAISLTNPPKEVSKKVEEVDIDNFANIFKTFLKSDWIKFVIPTAFVFGINFGITVGFKNPYQESLGFSLTTLGILWASSRILISGLLLTNGKVFKLLTFKQFEVTKTVLYGICFIIIGVTGNMWVAAIAFIFSTTITFGFGATRSQFDMEYIGDSKSKATLLSIKSFIQNIFIGISGLLMGMLVVAKSYPVAYLYFGVTLLVFSVILRLTLPKPHKK